MLGDIDATHIATQARYYTLRTTSMYVLCERNNIYSLFIHYIISSYIIYHIYYINILVYITHSAIHHPLEVSIYRFITLLLILG